MMGKLLVPDSHVRSDDGELGAWAADNGCYTKGDRFDLPSYLTWLDQFSPLARSRCLFATAPDIVGDAAATWDRSKQVLPLLRALEFPAALVAQDGIQDTVIEWDAFDALFIGGSTAWKLSEPTYALIGEAKRRGKWVHCGRVNSGRRFHAMAAAGCDSVDGTHLAFGPDKKLPQILSWLSVPTLALEAAQ